MRKVKEELISLLETSHLKQELNHIFYDSSNSKLVLTDTRFLMTINHKLEDVNQDILIVNDKAKNKEYFEEEYSDSLSSLIVKKGFKYPEYQRVMYNDNSYQYTKISLDITCFIESIMALHNICIGHKILSLFEKNKFLKGIKFDGFIYKDNKSLLQVISKDESVVITIMPIVAPKDFI